SAPKAACERSRMARISRMPSQKDGVARPAIEIVRITKSIGRSCFSAEIVPSGIAMMLEMTTAMMQISSEIGKRAAISWATGLPDHIEVVARADLPALDVGPIGNDPVPPQHRKLVRLAVDHVFLEIAHQGALPRRVGLVQHFLIEIDLFLIVIVPVVLGEDRGRKSLL